MTYIMTDEDVQTQYTKLKQIDKFAKELGVTIYDLKCSFQLTNHEYLVHTPIFENKLPEKWRDNKYYLNEEQKKQCKKIDEKINKMTFSIMNDFKKIGLCPSYYGFDYGTLTEIEVEK